MSVATFLPFSHRKILSLQWIIVERNEFSLITIIYLITFLIMNVSTFSSSCVGSNSTSRSPPPATLVDVCQAFDEIMKKIPYQRLRFRLGHETLGQITELIVRIHCPIDSLDLTLNDNRSLIIFLLPSSPSPSVKGSSFQLFQTLK